MTKANHMPSLDGLRGLAAIMVVIAHVIQIHPALKLPLPQHIGSTAVALFFTLSGFLMMVLYGYRGFSPGHAAGFLVSRFARIYPSYFVALCLTVPLSLPWLHYEAGFAGPWDLLRHLALGGSKGAFWSVPPEIQFYLLFPLLWFLVSRRQDSSLFVYMLAGLVAIIGLVGFPGPGILITSKLHFFLAGAVAGHVHIKAPEKTGHPLHGVLALGLCAFLFAQQRWNEPDAGARWDLEMALAAAVVVAAAAREHPWSAAILATPVLRWAGRVSFSLYLYHIMIIWLTKHLLGGFLPEMAEVLIGILLSGLAAEVINRFIEVPSRNRINAWWQARGAALTTRLLAQASPGTGLLRWTSR